MSMAMPEFAPHEESSERLAAESWVAKFAPLVLEEDALTVEEIRRRLDTVGELRSTIPSGDGGSGMSETVARAMGQMDGIETDLRRRLALLAPGDPLGLPDVEAINDRLAERAARREMGIDDLDGTRPLTLNTSPGNAAGGAALGIFGLGWNAFTLVHACLMIGGMYSTFGWPALFLVFFYAIFFGAGYMLLKGAFNTASKETIELDGSKLTVTRRLGAIVRQSTHTLDVDASARIGDSVEARPSGAKPPQAIIATDVDGKPVHFGLNSPPHIQEANLAKFNGYLALQR